MASFLDITLIQGYFSNIFIILFIFTATYAVLTFKKPFGDAKGINALMSFSVAIIFLFSPDAIEIVKSTVPWFILMMVALMFVLIVTSSVNASIPDSLIRSIGTWVLVIGIIILVLNISLRLGQRAGPYLNETGDNGGAVGGGDVASSSFTQNLTATLFHPKVLGMLLVLLIAVFAVLWIGYQTI